MSLLDRIFEAKRAEVREARAKVSEKELQARVADQEPVRGFLQALRGENQERGERVRGKGGNAAGQDETPLDAGSGRPLYPLPITLYPSLALIAEVKKASPSQGLIRPDFDPTAVALAYERAGATCLSVLTDGPNFQGSLENLSICRNATKLPCLRKDFLFDPYQVVEARAWGADAILLIAAMLSRVQIEDLTRIAVDLQMDILFEVHTEAEVDLANELGINLVGVNNRDLSTFKTNLSTSVNLIPKLKAKVKVSESALETRADLGKVHAAGATAVLIGTTFCKAPDIESKVGEVMGW